MSENTQDDDLPPLKLKCTSSNCENGTHCLKPKKRRGKHKDQPSPFAVAGSCRTCGKVIVDMTRVHRRDLSDVDYTIKALQCETIRSEFWSKAFDEKALSKAREIGYVGLIEAANRRMSHKKMASESARIFRDGTQTPLEGDVIYYAQHAIACCCRKCIDYWHGIPSDRPLGKQEIHYFVDLIGRYVSQRLPDLLAKKQED